MSQHPSLKGSSAITAKRSVLKRFERVELMKKRGQFKPGQRVIGLPKTSPRNRRRPAVSADCLLAFHFTREQAGLPPAFLFMRINRFLAAHAFASWTDYQGDGVLCGIRRLRLALAVLRAEALRAARAENDELTDDTLMQAIRQSDLLLVHLVDRQRLNSAMTGP